ncbi:hypothetical protein [Arcobacter roscoffensis]|uniref:HTH psq-type domain-containing protein n=1 Tax=Arcobacter roscoffensis TaxID=2961520 RepID=A0ABY5E560_9BACT|nr:hypothetical protein [Arcobacter roscoffensis]UTJ05891.1 hypothetical protein NJU99_11615 [Arcobacter roscoffensis]
MVDQSKVVEIIMECYGYSGKKFSEVTKIDSSTLSRHIINSGGKVSAYYRKKIIDGINNERKLNLKDNLFTDLFSDEIEVKKYLINESNNGTVFDNCLNDDEILKLVEGEWVISALSSNEETLNPESIRNYNLKINSNKTFELDRRIVPSIPKVEKGSIAIQNNAILLYCLDIRTNNDFISFHINRSDIFGGFMHGMVSGKNVFKNQYHGGIIVFYKKELESFFTKEIIVEILNSDVATHVFPVLEVSPAYKIITNIEKKKN